MAQKQSSHLSTKDQWECTMVESSAGWKQQQFNFQYFSWKFCFQRLLCHGWLLCKHSTDTGQTESFQSIVSNPVAVACFLGERCSLMLQSACTQTVTVFKRAAGRVSILAKKKKKKKASTSDKQTRHRKSLNFSNTNTKQEGHRCNSMC